MNRVASSIRRWQWLLLLLLLPILLFPTGLRSLFLLALPVLAMARWIDTRRFFPHTPYNVALLVMMFMALVSLQISFDIASTFPKVAGLTLGLMLFYGAIDYTREHHFGLWHLLAFFLLAATGMVLVSLVGIRWSGPFSLLNRIREWLPEMFAVIPGTADGSINPNETAGLLSWTIPLLVALVGGLWRSLWQKNKRRLGVLLGLTLFTSTILVATFSRGALLAVLLSLLVMAAIFYRQARWLLGAIAVAGPLLFLYFDAGQYVAGGRGQIEQLGLAGRLEIWSRALYALSDFPLTGVGMNGFRQIVHALYPLYLLTPGVDIAHAHNHLLQAGLDLGIPGLIAYLALWLISVVLLYQSWQRAQERSHKVLIAGLSGALAASWLYGIFDAIALGARPGFMWWLLLAMMTAVHEKV